MKIQVVISCMYEKDYSIINRSNIQTDTIVVNQCDIDSIVEFTFINKKNEECRVKFINTTDRGLSRSRNMCIDNATGDVLVVCDDDEVFEDNYESTIIEGYEIYPTASFIVFDVKRVTGNIHCSGEGKLNFKGILTSSSVQMTFRRKDIMDNYIRFDVKMGSGSGNGGGEENKFMMDIRRAGLKMMTRHKLIAKLLPGKSRWQETTLKKYFENLGWASRQWGGLIIGLVFIWYHIISHKNMYNKNITFLGALKAAHIGFFNKR